MRVSQVVYSSPRLYYMLQCLIYESMTSYLNNYWTKPVHICTHFDAFSMLIINMDMILNNVDLFLYTFSRKWSLGVKRSLQCRVES